MVMVRVGNEAEVKRFLTETLKIGESVKSLLPWVHPAIEENAGIPDVEIKTLGADLTGAPKGQKAYHDKGKNGTGGLVDRPLRSFLCGVRIHAPDILGVPQFHHVSFYLQRRGDLTVFHA